MSRVAQHAPALATSRKAVALDPQLYILASAETGAWMRPPPLACALMLGAVALSGRAFAQQPAAGTKVDEASRAGTQQSPGVPGAQSSGAPRGQISEQQRRRSIAALVELLMPAFNTADDGGAVRLRNAKIAGPIDHQQVVEGKTPHYCISADVDTAARLFSGTKSAVVKIEKRPKGEKLTLLRYPSSLAGCDGAYGPFPELEQLRNDRRQRLGKPI